MITIIMAMMISTENVYFRLDNYIIIDYLVKSLSPAKKNSDKVNSYIFGVDSVFLHI